MENAETKPSNRDLARAYLQDQAERCQGILTAFGKEIAEQDAFYALTWKAEDALKIAATLRELRSIIRGFDGMVQDGEPDEKIAEILAKEAQRFIDQLIGQAHYRGDGPWTPNSTGAMSNLGNICTANAMRSMIAHIKRAKARLLGQDKTLDYWAAD